MSRYEPFDAKARCGNCAHLDQSVYYPTYPVQARCKIFNELVFVNSETCLEDEKVVDCSTCRYGGTNDHWGVSLCHNTATCVDFDLWEAK